MAWLRVLPLLLLLRPGEGGRSTISLLKHHFPVSRIRGAFAGSRIPASMRRNLGMRKRTSSGQAGARVAAVVCGAAEECGAVGKRIVLASQSPRRRELLGALGFEFDVRAKDVDESFSPDMPPDQVAQYLAKKKAKASLPSMDPTEVVVAADTVVVLDDLIMNKPESREEAIAMISSLSGRSHRVITGVCIANPDGQEVSFDDEATVTFRELRQDEIEYYVDVHKPFDKAGSYGIQDWIGMAAVTRLEGSYYTVMGLPTARVYATLCDEFGFCCTAPAAEASDFQAPPAFS
mmetsp:Transcript_8656/g.15978  ORF Transcript_8656/g.15978 Transcript_8656/m.15978 type:complete len:291 (+) Transcript_8656:1-873(+)